METETFDSTISLINDFAKASVILKKVNKVINRNLKARVTEYEEHYSELLQDKAIACDIVNQDSLRMLIGRLHDRLFAALKSLSSEDRVKVYEAVCSYVDDHENRLAIILSEISNSCEELRELSKDDTLQRESLINKISNLSTAKEETKYYYETFLALKHYIGGLTKASRAK